MSDSTLERARLIADKYISHRARALETLERYVLGTQYEGRPDFLSPKEDVPLLLRGPNVVASVVENGIRSNGDFVLGEGRWPSIVSADTEDDDETNDALTELVTRARLKTAMRQALEAAQGSKSAAILCGVINGRPTTTVIPARCAEPTLDPKDPSKVLSLEIRYPYVEQFKGADGWEWRCRLYRRVIDDKRDVTFLPGETTTDGDEPAWVEDPDKIHKHGFGFCPVVWYAHLRKPCAQGFDGEAIHERQLDEIDAYNFSLSQRHRAALYCGDPQIVETGVGEDDGPSASGHAAIVQKNRNGPYVFGLSERGRPARKKGPGNIWTYEQENAKVSLLTLPEGALDAIDKNAKDLRAKINEGMAVVDLDVENAKITENATGKAQEIAYRRQLDHCDVIREDFGDAALVPTVLMHCKIARKLGQGAVKLKHLAKLPDPDTCTLDLVWGPYFRPNDLDAKQAVEATKEALLAGVITPKVAIEKLRPHFPMHADEDVLEALGLEQMKALDAFSSGSPTLEKIVRLRFVKTILPGLEDAELRAIERELGEAAIASVEMRDAMVENVTKDTDGDEPEAEREDREAGGGEPAQGRGPGNPPGKDRDS